MTPYPNSAPSDKDLEQATLTAERLMGFYPKIPAGDPKVFLTGLVELLLRYPGAAGWICSPISGIPAKHKFCPSLAEIREAIEERANGEREHQDRLERLGTSWGNESAKIAQEWPNYTGNRENATASPLCRKFGIRKVPEGWDAVDITRAAAIHKEDFPAFIEGILRDGAQPPDVKGFKRAFVNAKRAKEIPHPEQLAAAE